MGTWSTEYLTMVKDCINRESKLTDWERKFIDSISTRLENECALSDKQIAKLDDIWERVTAKG